MLVPRIQLRVAAPMHQVVARLPENKEEEEIDKQEVPCHI